uniref:Cyclic AMP-dependent transcription factor ATF-4 n=1 Tax=Sinocyclocheilus rhinocerous TaxID=307959 RepID=A0A673MSA7_9TELE
MTFSSRFGQDDMEVLLWDPSSPMADPLGSFLDKDEEVLPLGGTESPLSSFSSSPLPSLSPPCTPPSLQRGEKAGLNQLSLSWFSSDELCQDNGVLLFQHIDSLSSQSFNIEMDWMTERIDLSEFDLESLIDSYDSEDPPSSPEELIASLESQIDLESQPVASNNTPSPSPPVSAELEIKSEPASPVPSPSILPPESPTDTLELGCEVDIAEVQSPTPVEMRVPKIVLSLSPTRIVLVLAPKEEANVMATHQVEVVVDNPPSPTSPDPQTPASPLSRSCKVKPYPTPDSKPTQNQVKSASGSKVVVEKKKLKKMEQNKTAATRYRQKKRAEQEALQSECAALEERNEELAEKAESLTKEIQYLKELMDEVKRARESRNIKS